MLRRRATPPRRGMILLVVLSMLTLFAIVGIAFVLYAGAAADSARISRDSETALRVDFEPGLGMATFLNQLIFDVNDDLTGSASALRGHSLLRSMFGYNTTTGATNNVPFNGVGRMHYVHPAAPGVPTWLQNPANDDWYLVNYTYFAGDKFVRDPERY